MPTDAQRDAVRYDLSASSSVMPDTEIDLLYDRSTALYSGNDEAIEAKVRLLAIRAILISAAKMVDYTQNQSSEKLGQVFDHLYKIRTIFADDLLIALSDAGVSVNYGGLRRKPSRIIESPNDDPMFPFEGNDVSRFQ